MAYTDDEWETVMAFLNDAAEKPEPDGIGKTIDTAPEFVDMLRRTEAIKPNIVNSNAREAREFAGLQRQLKSVEDAAPLLQTEIDNHPGNPNPPGGGNPGGPNG